MQLRQKVGDLLFGPPCNLLRLRYEVIFYLRLFVCLSGCPVDYSENYERITNYNAIFEGAGRISSTSSLNFGGNPDYDADPGFQDF